MAAPTKPMGVKTVVLFYMTVPNNSLAQWPLVIFQMPVKEHRNGSVFSDSASQCHDGIMFSHLWTRESRAHLLTQT